MRNEEAAQPPCEWRKGLAVSRGGRSAIGAVESTVAMALKLNGKTGWLASQDESGSRFGRQLAACRVDVAAAGEAHGGGDAMLGEDRAEGLDPLR